MVYSQESVERGSGGSGRRSSMAMGSERSKPLHNFSLPRLKWGCQKHLRCVKVGSSDSRASSGEGRSPSPAMRYDFPSFRVESDDERLRAERRRSNGVAVAATKFKTRRGEIIDCDKEIGAVREKFMIDLRAAMDKMRDELLGDGLESGAAAAAAVTVAAAPSRNENGESGGAVDARPWNLRTRRAACKAPTDGGGKVTWSPSVADVAGDGLKPRNAAEKPRFAATLKRKEIEDDFVKMTGQRPPRRPKRRPRAVQKQVETLFPAFWSAEAITAEMYKVHDFSDNVKR